MSASLDERNVGGYSVAYRRDDIHFPVYITAALAAVFFTAAWITGAAYWLALAVTAAGFTYYNILVGDRAAHHWRQSVWHLYPSLRADPVASHRAYRSRSDRRARDDRPRSYRLCSTHLSTALSLSTGASSRSNRFADALAVVHGPPRRGAGQVRTVRPAADEIHRTFLRMWRYYRS